MVDAGDTASEVPVPIDVTKDGLSYHFQDAPVPSEPPVTVSVIEVLGQIGIIFETLIPVGAVDLDLTVRVTGELHAPGVPQDAFSDRT